MSKLLNHLLIIDVESTCWDRNVTNHPDNEIIEIGICLVDVAKLTIINRSDILVTPRISTISPFCTSLTTLTQSMIDEHSISFSDACAKLEKDFRSCQVPWASWGDYDRRQFERQCNKSNISYPFGPTHLNMKNLFALVMKLNKEVGMDKALEILHIPLVGTHHRGNDDAYNIAQIVCKIFDSFRLA